MKKKILRIVCIRCAQVTLRSHLVENLGLPLFQTLKNTVERRVQEDVARENNGYALFMHSAHLERPTLNPSNEEAHLC